MIEKYGSGIKRIQEGFIDYGLPEPIFEEIQGGFRVTVHSSPNNLKSFTINNTVGETVGEKLHIKCLNIYKQSLTLHELS